MAQPTNNILTPEQLDGTDYRKQYVEIMSDATDFATADTSLVLATVPFLPVGDSFVDIPLYPVGVCQSFAYNEGLPGQMIPELGSSRKIAASGTSMGSGTVARLALHGNSLEAALYRPTLMWIQSTDSLTELLDRIAGDDKAWIQGLNGQSISLFDADIDQYVDRVVSAGGLNSLLFKIPFGMVEVKRDPRQRVVAINFLEQCRITGAQAGLNAGQFQLMDSVSFEYERKRPLKSVGPFSLSDDTATGF